MIFATIKMGTKNKTYQILQFITAITSPSTKASSIIKTGLFITALLIFYFVSIESKFLIKGSDNGISSWYFTAESPLILICTF